MSVLAMSFWKVPSGLWIVIALMPSNMAFPARSIRSAIGERILYRVFRCKCVTILAMAPTGMMQSRVIGMINQL